MIGLDTTDNATYTHHHTNQLRRTKMLTPEVKTYIQNIINRRTAIASMQEQVKADIAALAETLDMKPAALSRAIALAEKELSKGGIINEQHVIIDMAENLSHD